MYLVLVLYISIENNTAQISVVPKWEYTKESIIGNKLKWFIIFEEC